MTKGWTRTATTCPASDTTRCTGIDDWIDLLDSRLRGRRITSSGTTAPLDPPHDKRRRRGMVLWKYACSKVRSEPTDKELNSVG